MHVAGRSWQTVRWSHGARGTCPLPRAGALGDQRGRVRQPQYDGAMNLTRARRLGGGQTFAPPYSSHTSACKCRVAGSRVSYWSHQFSEPQFTSLAFDCVILLQFVFSELKQLDLADCSCVCCVSACLCASLFCFVCCFLRLIVAFRSSFARGALCLFCVLA